MGHNFLINFKVSIFAVAQPLDAVARGNRLAIAMHITIDNKVLVGPSSVVTKAITDNAVVAGNPAWIVNYVDNRK